MFGLTHVRDNALPLLGGLFSYSMKWADLVISSPAYFQAGSKPGLLISPLFVIFLPHISFWSGLLFSSRFIHVSPYLSFPHSPVAWTSFANLFSAKIQILAGNSSSHPTWQYQLDKTTFLRRFHIDSCTLTYIRTIHYSTPFSPRKAWAM